MSIDKFIWVPGSIRNDNNMGFRKDDARKRSELSNSQLSRIGCFCALGDKAHQ
jgi:hypothetical protein